MNGHEDYDDSHRAFLQAFLSRSVMKFEQAQPILAAILSAKEEREISPADITIDDFKAYISAISGPLSLFDYEIRSARPQTGSGAGTEAARVYALVNAASDPLTQLATTHSPEEIAYVKRLLDAMFETNNTAMAEVMAVSGIQAARLHKPANNAGQSFGGPAAGAGDDSQLPGTQQQQQANTALTMAQAEKCLVSLVAEGWFEKSRAGFYSLTPRALMELRGWLMETYNEPTAPDEDEDADGYEPPVRRIRQCHACREIVTAGQRCATAECECRLHNACAAHFFRDQSAVKCPKCGTAWTSEHPVGEKADRQHRSSRGGNLR